MQRLKYNSLTSAPPSRRIKDRVTHEHILHLNCIMAYFLNSSMWQTLGTHINSYLNWNEYYENRQNSVPEGPSAVPEVSFQPLGTAEVCKQTTCIQETKGANK